MKPTVCPSTRASAVHRLRAKAPLISKKLPISLTAAMILRTSYPRESDSGSRSSSDLAGSSDPGGISATGGGSLQLLGKKLKNVLIASSASRSVSTMRSANPVISPCTWEPPSSCAVTSRPKALETILGLAIAMTASRRITAKSDAQKCQAADPNDGPSAAATHGEFATAQKPRAFLRVAHVLAHDVGHPHAGRFTEIDDGKSPFRRGGP